MCTVTLCTLSTQWDCKAVRFPSETRPAYRSAREPKLYLLLAIAIPVINVECRMTSTGLANGTAVADRE